MAAYAMLLALCGILVVVSGQSTTIPPPPVIDGPCPVYTPIAILNSPDMVGPWFVVQEIRGGFGTHDPKHSEKCLTMNFTPQPDKSLFYKWTLLTPDNQKLEGNATTSLIDGKNTRLSLKIGDAKNATSVLTFLDVDPASHAAYVVCETDGKTHRFTVEVASRQKTLDTVKLDNIKKKLTENKLPTDLHAIPQTC